MRDNIPRPDYLPIEQLIDLIDEPNRTCCHKILKDNRGLFEKARGSTNNHQTWKGGYIDHITDGMNYARHLYYFDVSFGRRIPFSISDALLVFFLHDLEKPWKIKLDANGKATKNITKLDAHEFRKAKVEDYGIKLTPEQENGFKYVEGELDDYTNKRRVMNELAAFCHKVDVWSARGWYDYPRNDEDGWFGAQKFRIT